MNLPEPEFFDKLLGLISVPSHEAPDASQPGVAGCSAALVPTSRCGPVVPQLRVLSRSRSIGIGQPGYVHRRFEVLSFFTAATKAKSSRAVSRWRRSGDWLGEHWLCQEALINVESGFVNVPRYFFSVRRGVLGLAFELPPRSAGPGRFRGAFAPRGFISGVGLPLQSGRCSRRPAAGSLFN